MLLSVEMSKNYLWLPRGPLKKIRRAHREIIGFPLGQFAPGHCLLATHYQRNREAPISPPEQ